MFQTTNQIKKNVHQKSPLDVPHRVRTKVFSQKPGLKPMRPTYFGQNENQWFDMSDLGNGFATKNKSLY